MERNGRLCSNPARPRLQNSVYGDLEYHAGAIRTAFRCSAVKVTAAIQCQDTSWIPPVTTDICIEAEIVKVSVRIIASTRRTQLENRAEGIGTTTSGCAVEVPRGIHRKIGQWAHPRGKTRTAP